MALSIPNVKIFAFFARYFWYVCVFLHLAGGARLRAERLTYRFMAIVLAVGFICSRGVCACTLPAGRLRVKWRGLLILLTTIFCYCPCQIFCASNCDDSRRLRKPTLSVGRLTYLFLTDVFVIGFNYLMKRSGKKFIFTLSALIVFEQRICL